MAYQKLLQVIPCTGLILFLLIGCTSAPPSISASPVPPTTTPVPLTATPEAAIPQAGHWQGTNPSVSFDITETGEINNFEMIVNRQPHGDCSVKLDPIAVEADNTFVSNSLIAYDKLFSSLSELEKDFIMANTVAPTPFVTDAGEMYKALAFTGEFTSATEVNGTYVIMHCGNIIFHSDHMPKSWTAEWAGN